MAVRSLAFTLRSLRRTPAFSLIAALTLAIGIGATSAILALVDAVLIDGIPYREPERIVFLSGAMTREGTQTSWPLGHLDLEAARERRDLFESLSPVTAPRPFNLSADGVVEHVTGEMVGAEFFAALGVPIRIGRSFLDSEVRAPGARLVVLSHDLWRTRFGGDSAALGATLRLNDESYTVVGVAGAGFRGVSDEAELWLPIGLSNVIYGAHYTEMRQFRWLSGVARLARDRDAPDASAGLDELSSALQREFPAENEGLSIELQSLADAYFGSLRRPLLSLLAAAGFVLLIACVNVANLQLARGAARRREFALRIALGAGARRLATQVMLEGAVLVVGAALVGVLAAQWVLGWLAATGLLELASFVSPRLDARVVLASLAAALVTMLGFGIIPAFAAARTAPLDGLGDGGKGATSGARRGRVQRLLVAAEVALAFMLIAGAGLMIKGFRQFSDSDLGFAQDGLLTMTLDLTGERYAQNEPVWSLARSAVARLREVPGVRGVALEGPGIVTSGSYAAHFHSADDPAPDPVDHMARRHHVTPGYFETLGIRLIAGREFGDEDAPHTARSIVVSRSFAERVWPGRSALDRQLRSIGPNPVAFTVVGIADDVAHAGLDPDATDFPDVYLSLYQSPPRSPARISVLARSHGDAAAFATGVREALRDVAPELPPYDVLTMRERLQAQTRSARLLVWIMSAFAVLALVLAAVGTFGVLSYTVSQRTRELGIRAALGAQRPDLVRHVLHLGTLPVAIGLAIGLGGAWALTRLVTSMLYGVDPMDPSTLAATALFMSGVALVACVLPAIRAARVNPQTALRAD